MEQVTTMASINDVEQAVKRDEEVVDLTIYDKQGDPYLAADGSEATIGVLGSESAAYRKAEARASRRIVKARRTRLKDEDIRVHRIDRATAAVVRWHGWEDGKKALDCTPENVKRLLAFDHILEQVETGIQEHASFFAASSGS